MVLSVDLEEIVEEISELGGLISEQIDAAVENTVRPFLSSLGRVKAPAHEPAVLRQMDYVRTEMTATVETLEKTVEEAVGEFVDIEKTKRELKWWQHKWWQSKRRLDKRMARGRKRYNQGSLKIWSIAIGVAWFCMQPMLNHTGCNKSFLERASVGLAWPAGHYCGPSNGQEYRRRPRDPLDAICAQVTSNCRSTSRVPFSTPSPFSRASPASPASPRRCMTIHDPSTTTASSTHSSRTMTGGS